MRTTIRFAVATALFLAVFAALLLVQPPSYQAPGDVIPGRPTGVQRQDPHVINTLTSIRDRVNLSQSLSPSAKSLHTTLLYGPVTYRLCTYCGMDATRDDG